jgi:non-heme chloroperoxidase
LAAGWSTAACLKSLRDEELFSDLAQINVPTLILHGIHDKICPYQLALAQKEGIKDAKLVPFETSGHGLFYEEWGKLNHEMEYFVYK